MDLMELLIRSNQVSTLEHIIHLIGAAGFAQCRLVSRVWATHVFSTDVLSRMRLRRTLPTLRQPWRHFSTFFKLNGVVKEAKVQGDHIYILVKVDWSLVLLEVDSRSWKQTAAYSMRANDKSVWMSAMAGTVVVHTGNPFDFSHYSIKCQGRRFWNNSYHHDCQRINSASPTTCSCQGGRLSSIYSEDALSRLLTQHGCHQTMSKSSFDDVFAKFFRAHITDQHLLVINAEGVLSVRDLLNMDVICSVMAPPALVQSRQSESVQLRIVDNATALLVWRSGERTWMWNIRQDGAPRCFYEAGGDLFVTSRLLVEYREQGTKMRAYQIGKDINVAHEDELNEDEEDLQSLLISAATVRRTKTLHLDNRFMLSVGQTRDCLFVSDVGPFPTSACSKGDHGLCPWRHRKVGWDKDEQDLLMTQYSNVRCDQNKSRLHPT